MLRAKPTLAHLLHVWLMEFDALCKSQVEITLQPWHAFKPDGVVLFSDILTPLAGAQYDGWSLL